MEMADEWGRDPEVRFLRRIFAQMEEALQGALMQWGLAPFDTRLRRIRESALRIFEAAWALANRKGVKLPEDQLSVLYLHCLARSAQSQGIHIPPDTLSANAGLETLLKEAGA